VPNRNLSTDELTKAWRLIESINLELEALAGGDAELLFAYRRKVYKELIYGERGKPMLRRALKRKKRLEQKGLCAACAQPLPDKYAILDRIIAKDGYTQENTRLLCAGCDTGIQKDRGYA
jgi:5-methylcytosine-specific restriction endonuclease McrA